MVDWRGRWIDDEEYGDIDEVEEEEGDKQMEDFDPVRLRSVWADLLLMHSTLSRITGCGRR